jgi:hypothetical protein
MIWTESTTSSNVPTQYFIPEQLRNDFGKINAALRGFLQTQESAKWKK